MATALAATTADHSARAQRQSPCASGRTPTGVGEGGRYGLADQESGAVDGGGDGDAAREPLSDQRRKRGLAHRDADAHQEGRGEQHRRARAESAQGAEHGDEAEPRHQRSAHAELGDEQRPGHRGDGQQQHRQRDQGSDRFLVEVQLAMDERDQRRHGEHRQPEVDAAQQQEEQPNPVRTGQPHLPNLRGPRAAGRESEGPGGEVELL